jgi:hypothetical protein
MQNTNTTRNTGATTRLTMAPTTKLIAPATNAAKQIIIFCDILLIYERSRA